MSHLHNPHTGSGNLDMFTETAELALMDRTDRGAWRRGCRWEQLRARLPRAASNVDSAVSVYQEFLDGRYRSTDWIWSGRPNPQLVAQVADLIGPLQLEQPALGPMMPPWCPACQQPFKSPFLAARTRLPET